MKTLPLLCCRISSSYLAYTILVLGIWYGGIVDANQAPDLISNQVLIITGPSTPIDVVHHQLQATDPEGDTFEFLLKTFTPKTEIKLISVSTSGLLKISTLCNACTGEVKFAIELKDSQGGSQTYAMTVRLRERTKGTLTITSEPLPSYAPSKGLHRWHIYLIILGVIIAVTIVAGTVMYNCCTFQTDIYELPFKRSNKIVEKPEEHEIGSSMNPYAKPKKASLIVREALRAGAVDGTPYYGTRRSGVWIPEVPDDNKKSEPAPPRLKSVAEEGRRTSYAAPPPSPPTRQSNAGGHRDSKALLGRLSWYDITAPRR